MPMHDWTRVDAGIYHDFHSEWIIQIKHALNARLPGDFYALVEQHAANFGPDVLTLQSAEPFDPLDSGGTATMARPNTKLFQEAAPEFYRRKQNSIAIRHVSGDRVVAMIELVSPGNKNSSHGIRAFVDKAHELLKRRIHLLIIDPFPVGIRDPHGLHALIFADYQEHPLPLPMDAPLSLIAYECTDSLCAYLEPFAVGDTLADMPVYLTWGWHIMVPLEDTYNAAWQTVPRRWRDVIAPGA